MLLINLKIIMQIYDVYDERSPCLMMMFDNTVLNFAHDQFFLQILHSKLLSNIHTIQKKVMLVSGCKRLSLMDKSWKSTKA